MKHFYAFLVLLLIGAFGFGQTTGDAWINEIHYSDLGGDAGEGVEIVIADVSTYPLANWSIIAYNGNNGNLYDSVNFATPDSQSTNNGFTIASKDIIGLQNGAPDGLALVYNNSIVVQFLSYEGAFTANDGVAVGLTSQDIGVEESNNSPDGESLQLGGTGSIYSDFSWQTVTSFTFGTVNNNQTLISGGGCTEPTTQASAYNTTSISGNGATLNWTAGDGNQVLVLVKEGAAVDADPENGTGYSGNTTFSSGDQIGTGNYVVQSGSATSSVSITGLTEATTYHVAVYEYNTTDTCYNLTALTGNFITNCSTPTDVTTFTATAGNTTVDLSWSNETCFDEILVVAKANSAVTAMPSGDGSAYTANSTIGLGTNLGTGEFAVYKGIGTAVTVTGLTNGITYHFKVFARKGTSWSAGVNGNSIPNNILSTGNIIISEIMHNPSDVGDIAGEYFEVYNATGNPINMFGWTISDNGADSHIITSDLIVPAFGFAVLGRNADISTNGGVIIDYEYSNFDLANNSDEIILTDLLFLEIDRVEYDNGATFPDPNGAAMIYLGSDIEDNSDSSLWGTATIAEGIDVDFGSPGSNGTDQIVAYLVFVNNAWNTAPTALTGARTGLIKSNESTSFTTDISLVNLFIKEGADLTITSGNTLTLSTVILESISDSYSSIILDGTIVGTVKYKRYVNANSGGNDLISPPLSGESWTDFLASDTNATDLLSSGTTYAFGPFDKTVDDFVNYTSTTSTTLVSGTGYRAATVSGTTLTFSGSVPTSAITVNITDTGATYPDWNLIGNPYPSYIGMADFLNYDLGSGVTNMSILEDLSGIYGYDGSASSGWDVVTLANAGTRLMTPGQGFFVAANDAFVASHDMTFDTSMTTPGTDDDFIFGRNANVLTFLKLNASTVNKDYTTEFYFNTNASLGLDHGYDGKILGNLAPNFALYSHLVQDNPGLPIALQALNPSDLTNTVIPLGINSNQGEQITISISETTLPSTVEVYLEDNILNTFTLLNAGDYTLTPASNLNGIGRFYLRLSNTTLSIPETTVANLSIYSDQSNKTIVIAGQLLEVTTANIYDIQGRVVNTSILQNSSRSQSIDVSNLSAGVYVVHIINGTQNKTQKVIIK